MFADSSNGLDFLIDKLMLNKCLPTRFASGDTTSMVNAWRRQHLRMGGPIQGSHCGFKFYRVQSKQLIRQQHLFYLAMETTSRLWLIGVFMIWTPFAANLHPTVKTGTGRSNMKSVCIYVRQKSPQHTHCLRHHHVRPKLIGVHKDESNTKPTYHQEIKRYKYKKLKHISDLLFQS